MICPNPLKGRSYVVANTGRDAVDAGSVGARGEEQGGQRIEPNPVSSSRRARRRRLCPAKPLGEAGWPAYGKIAWSWLSLLQSSFAEAKSAQPSRSAVNSQGDGGQRNSAPGRARHKPSTTAQGRPGCPRLPCDLPVHSCARRSAQGPWVPAGARSSLRPLLQERDTDEAKLGQNMPRDYRCVLAV